jgi:hypothetical protein
VGRLSLKVPGTTENGSVFCHASVFAAYGLAMTGHPDHRSDIPQQLPPYQLNSYFYRPGHPQSGLSTGTLGTENSVTPNRLHGEGGSNSISSFSLVEVPCARRKTATRSGPTKPYSICETRRSFDISKNIWLFRGSDVSRYVFERVSSSSPRIVCEHTLA